MYVLYVCMYKYMYSTVASTSWVSIGAANGLPRGERPPYLSEQPPADIVFLGGVGRMTAPRSPVVRGGGRPCPTRPCTRVCIYSTVLL